MQKEVKYGILGAIGIILLSSARILMTEVMR